MRLFKSNIDELFDKNAAKPSKRFISVMVDFLLLALITLGIYNLSYLILKNSTVYNEYETTIKNEISYYNNYIKDTHLVEFIDNNKEVVRKDNETMSIELINKHIVRSYHIDPSQFIVEPTLSLRFEEATIETDNLAYFFNTYVPKNNENNDILDFQGTTPINYYTNFIQNIIKNDFNSYFLVEKENNFIYINPYVASKIYTYLALDDKNQEKVYQKIFSTFSYAFEEAEKLVLNSKIYNATHFKPYLSALDKQGQMVNISFILTAFVSYFLIIALPQIFFRDGVTFGRLLMGLGTISNNRQKIKFWQVLLRNLFGCLGSLIVVCLLPVLPIFNFQFNNFPCTLIDFGFWHLSLGWTLVIVLILNLIFNIIIFFNKENKTLTDFITNSKVVDIKNIN